MSRTLQQGTLDPSSSVLDDYPPAIWNNGIQLMASNESHAVADVTHTNPTADHKPQRQVHTLVGGYTALLDQRCGQSSVISPSFPGPVCSNACCCLAFMHLVLWDTEIALFNDFVFSITSDAALLFLVLLH
jgi:hypothetical protein